MVGHLIDSWCRFSCGPNSGHRHFFIYRKWSRQMPHSAGADWSLCWMTLIETTFFGLFEGYLRLPSLSPVFIHILRMFQEEYLPKFDIYNCATALHKCGLSARDDDLTCRQIQSDPNFIRLFSTAKKQMLSQAGFAGFETWLLIIAAGTFSQLRSRV